MPLIVCDPARCLLFCILPLLRKLWIPLSYAKCIAYSHSLRKIHRVFSDHPEIIYFYPEVSALVGESIYLPCVAVGNPAANISWEYNGQLISKFPRYEVGPNGSLILEDVKEQDKGIYTCTPFNKWYGKKREAKLIVLGMYCKEFYRLVNF